MFKTLASDLTSEDIIVAVIAPGAVNTDMRRAAVGAARAAKDLPVDESVRAMIKVIDGLSRADSGRALNYDGRILPWQQPCAASSVSYGSRASAAEC